MHDHDKKWFKQQLNKLPTHLKISAIENYKLVFIESGRSAANTRLRLYVERITKGVQNDNL
jgi:hypothetical protein